MHVFFFLFPALAYAKDAFFKRDVIMNMGIFARSMWNSAVPVIAEVLLLASIVTVIVSVGAILMHYRCTSIPILRSIASIGSTNLYVIFSGSLTTMILCSAILHRHEKKHHQ